MDSLRNLSCTQLLRKAHTLMQLTRRHQAARSETGVIALRPGSAASPASEVPAPQLLVPQPPPDPRV